MLEGLSNVVVKEVRELIRDPKILIGMIVVPALIFPLMGLALRVSMQTAVESVKTMSIGVMDQDGRAYAQNLTEFLLSSNFTVVKISASSVDQAARDIQNSNITALVVIPEGFSQNLTDDKQAELKVYGVFRGTGIAENTGFAAVNALIGTFNQILALQKAQGNETILNPISLSQASIVKEKIVNVNPSVLFSLVMSQYVGMPIGIIMLIVFAMQIAATSVASEKEEKTLETLLSMPIGRFTILVGKLTGSVIVAAVGALAYVLGFNYYMGSFTAAFPAQAGVDLASVGLAPSLPAYLVLGASLFVALLSALALATAISSFAEDVRSAQTTAGYIYFVLFIPMILLMYSDINALPLPLRLALLAIPYTHPMLAARAAFTGDYTTAVFGIIYVTIFTIAVLYVAARIFTTEKILTMRLRLRRAKVKREE